MNEGIKERITELREEYWGRKGRVKEWINEWRDDDVDDDHFDVDSAVIPADADVIDQIVHRRWWWGVIITNTFSINNTIDIHWHQKWHIIKKTYVIYIYMYHECMVVYVVGRKCYPVEFSPIMPQARQSFSPSSRSWIVHRKVPPVPPSNS